MTTEDMRALWPLAKVLHEARRNMAWGNGTRREPWPEFSTAYPHSPIAYVDLALAQAAAARRYFERNCDSVAETPVSDH